MKRWNKLIELFYIRPNQLPYLLHSTDRDVKCDENAEILTHRVYVDDAASLTLYNVVEDRFWPGKNNTKMNFPG